jgi:hypothetical protein
LTIVCLSIFTIVWATAFLIFWRRRQAEIAFQWNTLDMQTVEDIRPSYKGELRLSPVTDQYEPHYPTWKRLLFRLCVTIPLLVINLILVSFLIVVIFRLQHWIDRQLKLGHLPRLFRLVDGHT